MNYDPNLTTSGRMATQTIELTFQQWEYTATFTTTVGGNCRGYNIFDAAIDNVFEDLGGEDGEMTLKKENGDTLAVELWEDDIMKDMLVGARIVAIEPKKD